MIAALYVAAGGHYFGLPDVDPWDEVRDARLYDGPWPVVAHPPCQRWGRYWSGGPNPKAKRRELGDDGGCFKSALAAVRKFGGVLEHPEASKAWDWFALNKPPKSGGWVSIGIGDHGWTCCTEQGHYGHPARKATWLLYYGRNAPPELIWGPSTGMRMDEGFNSKEHRRRARAAGQRPIHRLSESERIATPPAFRDLLLRIARSCRA